MVSESIGSRRGSQVQLWSGMEQQLHERERRGRRTDSHAVKSKLGRIKGKDKGRRPRWGSDSKWGALRCSNTVGCLHWNRKRKWILRWQAAYWVQNQSVCVYVLFLDPATTKLQPQQHLVPNCEIKAWCLRCLASYKTCLFFDIPQTIWTYLICSV